MLFLIYPYVKAEEELEQLERLSKLRSRGINVAITPPLSPAAVGDLPHTVSHAAAPRLVMPLNQVLF